jgi:hypothetical protein
MLQQLSRGVIRDMSIRNEGMQLMVDLVREDSKVAQPFSVGQIVDYSFLVSLSHRLQLRYSSMKRWNPG